MRSHPVWWRQQSETEKSPRVEAIWRAAALVSSLPGQSANSAMSCTELNPAAAPSLRLASQSVTSAADTCLHSVFDFVDKLQAVFCCTEFRATMLMRYLAGRQGLRQFVAIIELPAVSLARAPSCKYSAQDVEGPACRPLAACQNLDAPSCACDRCQIIWLARCCCNL